MCADIMEKAKKWNEDNQLIYGYPIDGPYDLEVWYRPEEGIYTVSVETLIGFEDEVNGSRKFVKALLKEFTDWMKENGYSTAYRIPYTDVFYKGIVLPGEYKSIEEAYAAFKILVLGFNKYSKELNN